MSINTNNKGVLLTDRYNSIITQMNNNDEYLSDIDYTLYDIASLLIHKKESDLTKYHSKSTS